MATEEEEVWKEVNYIPFGETGPKVYKVRVRGVSVWTKDFLKIIFEKEDPQVLVKATKETVLTIFPLGNTSCPYPWLRNAIDQTEGYKHFLNQGGWRIFKAQLFPEALKKEYMDYMADPINQLHSDMWSQLDDVAGYYTTVRDALSDHPKCVEEIEEFIRTQVKRLRRKYDMEEKRLLNLLPKKKRIE
jgi:hypothetical protein